MSARLVPRVTPLLPHRPRPSPAIAPSLAASLARVLAARSTDPTWSRSLAALLPAPLPDARLAAAVSALGDADPDLAHSALLRLLARARRFDGAQSSVNPPANQWRSKQNRTQTNTEQAHARPCPVAFPKTPMHGMQ